jgi:hypothetical protein
MLNVQFDRGTTLGLRLDNKDKEEIEGKKTAKKILIKWLTKHVNQTIAYHDLENNVPVYGKVIHSTQHSAGTYRREFAWLKKDEELLKKNKLDLEQLVEGSGRVNKWKINLLKEETK